MPNGRSIVLERQQGADAAGYSGLEDEVDNHWTELFKAALLSTILGVGAELIEPQEWRKAFAEDIRAMLSSYGV